MTWERQKNNDATPKTKQDIYGYTVGGPIGKPGGNNKLFFFYAHEFRPTTLATNGGDRHPAARADASSRRMATSRRAATTTAT